MKRVLVVIFLGLSTAAQASWLDKPELNAEPTAKIIAVGEPISFTAQGRGRGFVSLFALEGGQLRLVWQSDDAIHAEQAFPDEALIAREVGTFRFVAIWTPALRRWPEHIAASRLFVPEGTRGPVGPGPDNRSWATQQFELIVTETPRPLPPIHITGELAASDEENRPEKEPSSQTLPDDRFAPETLSARAQEKVALLIGNARYAPGWNALPAIPGELQQVEEILSDLGYRVTTKRDLDADQMRETLQRWITGPAAHPETQALVFYAGHGYSFRPDDKGYLVPTDAPHPQIQPKTFRERAIGMDEIVAWARVMRARQGLFVFDSCFSGAVFLHRGSSSNDSAVDRLRRLPVRQFITAGSALETVPGKSAFVPLFVAALRDGQGDLNGDGLVTGMELGLHLQQSMPAHVQQTPQFGKIRDPQLSGGDYAFEVKAPGEVLNKPPQWFAELEVLTFPKGAEVFVDDTFVGEAPLVTEVALKRHNRRAHVRAEMRGFKARYERVTLRASKLERAAMRLEEEE